jgi:dTDP-4-dehydrorhamnose reductase
MKILVFGQGYIGTQYVNSDLWPDISAASADITHLSEVEKAIKHASPDMVINAAGKTNLEWCRDNKIEALLVNVAGPLNLLKVCQDQQITMVHLSSGCIFEGTGQAGQGFTETDTPNPGCFYAETKVMSDQALASSGYNQLLILRLRQPFGPESHQRSIITKALSFPKALTSQQSITFVPDLLKATKHLLEHKQFGIFNITNPGSLSPYDIALLAKETLKLDQKIGTISKTEMDALDKAANREHRVDTILNTSKLEATGCQLPSLEQRVKEVLQTYKQDHASSQDVFAHH